MNPAKKGKSEDQALPGSREGGAGAGARQRGCLFFHFRGPGGTQELLPSLCWEGGAGPAVTCEWVAVKGALASGRDHQHHGTFRQPGMGV